MHDELSNAEVVIATGPVVEGFERRKRVLVRLHVEKYATEVLGRFDSVTYVGYHLRLLSYCFPR